MNLRWFSLQGHLAVCVVIVVMATGFAEEVRSGREQILTRVRSDIRYLTSDELEGRGVETEGIRRAAQYIVGEYQNAGLKAGMPDGSWFQSFPVLLGPVTVTDSTRVVLTSPDGTVKSLALRDEFQPIRRGADGEAAGSLVFIGYGITSEEDSYDDYADIDVRDKIVVMIRREPQNRQGGAFRGTETSTHAFIDRKLELVRRSGAAGILFVNDYKVTLKDGKATVDENETDELADPSTFGNEGSAVPFAHVRRSVIDSILKVTPLKVEGDQLLSGLAAVSEYIDTSLKPLSQEIPGWSAELCTRFEAKSVSADNVIGVVEGAGSLSEETIVIGGHYDHLGYGGFGSRAQKRTGEIHYGADDNASGTAAVLELARRVAAGPPPQRRMVFICFSGEERGLIGSHFYVNNPVFPIQNTVAMLNFDMIGNLRNNRVEVNGVGTASEFSEIVRKADEATPIDITIVAGAFAGSDHLPFYQKGIPVMFCFTGMTSIYHTPDDTFESLNIEGAVKVIDYSEQLLRGIDRLENRPTPQQTRDPRQSVARTPFLGIQPDIGASEPGGILLRGVTANSPAAAAGLQVGDVIIAINDAEVEGNQTLTDQLAASAPGQKMRLKLKRGTVILDTEVVLGASRR